MLRKRVSVQTGKKPGSPNPEGLPGSTPLLKSLAMKRPGL
jgi:hypothetical protein